MSEELENYKKVIEKIREKFMLNYPNNSEVSEEEMYILDNFYYYVKLLEDKYD